MIETLFSRQPALLIPILAVLGSAVVFTVWIIAHYWGRARQLEMEAALKQDMLNRGLSAADIERVLFASSRRDEAPPEPTETISDNEYYLVEKMLEEGHSVEEIERLVRAFKDGTTNIRLPRRVEA
jgi:hypothetical protein